MPGFCRKGFTQTSACPLQDLAQHKPSRLDLHQRAAAEIFCLAENGLSQAADLVARHNCLVLWLPVSTMPGRARISVK